MVEANQGARPGCPAADSGSAVVVEAICPVHTFSLGLCQRKAMYDIECCESGKPRFQVLHSLPPPKVGKTISGRDYMAYRIPSGRY
jgi:hypothetical protein